MTRKRVLSIFALIFNLAIVGLGAYAFALAMFPITEGKDFAYLHSFTHISNYLMMLVALMCIPVNIKTIAKPESETPIFFRVIKLLATTCVGITLIVVLTWLGPRMGYAELFKGMDLIIYHAVIPGLAIISYIFFENTTRTKYKHTWWILIPLVAYGAAYYLCNYFKIWVKPDGTMEDMYGLMNSMYVFAAIGVGGYLLSLLLWGLNTAGYKLGKYDAPKDVEIPEEENATPKVEEVEENLVEVEEKVEKPTPAKKPANQTKKTAKPKNSKSSPKKKEPKEEEKPAVRVYHISKSKTNEGKWQVKLASGERAVKLFDTQSEAITFAKGLVRTNGGSIRIHSVSGKMRK